MRFPAIRAFVASNLTLVACSVGGVEDGRQLGVTTSNVVSSLDELVCREFGFSYRAASSASSDLLSDAHAILGDRLRERCWSKTILFMGARGGRRELDRLRSFIVQADGEIGLERLAVIGHVPYAIGYLPGRHTGTELGDEATGFLIECSEPSYWDLSRRSWHLDGPSEKAQTEKLSRICITGLGFSRSTLARQRLLQLTGKPGGPRPQADAADSLKVMDEVEAAGSLERYLESSDGEWDTTTQR